MSPLDYRLRTNVIERLRSHYSGAVLLVYHVPISRMFVKRIRDVNWDSISVVTSNGTPYYALQYAGTGEPNFENIEEFFPKVPKELIDDRKRIMSHLFRQYFAGLEQHGHSLTNPFDSRWAIQPQSNFQRLHGESYRLASPSMLRKIRQPRVSP